MEEKLKTWRELRAKVVAARDAYATTVALANKQKEELEALAKLYNEADEALAKE
jgi:hypothetical protein